MMQLVDLVFLLVGPRWLVRVMQVQAVSRAQEVEEPVSQLPDRLLGHRLRMLLPDLVLLDQNHLFHLLYRGP